MNRLHRRAGGGRRRGSTRGGIIRGPCCTLLPNTELILFGGCTVLGRHIDISSTYLPSTVPHCRVVRSFVRIMMTVRNQWIRLASEKKGSIGMLKYRVLHQCVRVFYNDTQCYETTHYDTRVLHMCMWYSM